MSVSRPGDLEGLAFELESGAFIAREMDNFQSINQSININVPVSTIKKPKSVARLHYASL